jgi:hypothetical protein
MGRAYALSGNRAEPQKLSQKIESDSNRKYVSPYWLAIIHFGLNEMDETFAWLQKAYDERNAWLVYLNVNPLFDRIRTDSRFEGLLKLMGFRQ